MMTITMAHGTASWMAASTDVRRIYACDVLPGVLVRRLTLAELRHRLLSMIATIPTPQAKRSNAVFGGASGFRSWRPPV